MAAPGSIIRNIGAARRMQIRGRRTDLEGRLQIRRWRTGRRMRVNRRVRGWEQAALGVDREQVERGRGRERVERERGKDRPAKGLRGRRNRA